MPHILGIGGSPRGNGNTHILVSHILDGAREAGAATELVLLKDLSIQECDGCHACWHGRPCPRGDDMDGLCLKLIQADAIVLGTPVYWYGPTALMKAFIDRLVYFNCPENRAKIRGKPVAIAVTLEEPNPETASLLMTFFQKCLAYLELPLAAAIVVPGLVRKGGIAEKPDRLEEARRIGRDLATARRARPQFKSL